jgi:Zn-dependent protease/CBS domain-containing protein
LLIIFALIMFQLGAAVFPSWHPGWSVALIWSMASATAVLFFASVLVHELSHALVARSQGIPVRRITLFLFGGLTELEGEPATPKSEFLIAIVGPIVSIAIGLAATFAGAALIRDGLIGTAQSEVLAEALEPAAFEAAIAHAGPGATLLLWLGPVNLLLGVFNLVPGFPLDGGRVLRSALWAATRDLRKATRWASFAGQAFAWILMGLGVLYFFRGVWVSGLWLLLIGWFLNNAARASYEHLLMRLALEDIPVSRVMRSSFVSVPPDLSVEAFIRDYALASDQQVFPVEADDGRLLGTVGVPQLQLHARSHESGGIPGGTPVAFPVGQSVGQIMVPRDRLPTLPPDAGAERAMRELSRSEVDQLAIVEGERLLGLVRRDDLLRWLSIHAWLHGDWQRRSAA